jgi:ABC-type uncharacterized transport system ATPase subunit
MSRVVAALRNVTKAYPGVLACQQVSVEFHNGEIHALLGENGAGKSTIVKILAGLIKPDAGTVEIGGRAIRLSGPQASRGSGVGVVHQAGSLISTLTVRENLLIGRLYRAKGKDHLANEKLRNRFRIDIDPDRLVRDLSPSERQLIEVYRLLCQNVTILVLDEPTATLSPQESDLLFQELRTIADAGYTVVVISHKLPEIVANSDRFTILKKGRVIARIDRANATTETLTTLLSYNNSRDAGHPNLAKAEVDAAPEQDGVIARFNRLSTSPKGSRKSPLCNVDLSFRRNEILGIAGRPDSGASTIFEILYGSPVPITHGSVDWIGTDAKAANRKIGFIPADRLGSGTIADFTIAENLALRRRTLLGWRGRKSNALRGFADALIDEFAIQPPNPELKVQNLSGGNLQKVLLAREVNYAEDIFLAISPLAGLDLKAVSFVQKVLREKAASGACVIVHSDDIDELVSLADRIIVVSRGRIVEELVGGEITREAIGLALEEVPINQQPLETIRQGR